MSVFFALIGVCTLLYGKSVIKKRHFYYWGYAYNPMLQLQLHLLGWEPEYRGKQAVRIGQWYVMGSNVIFGLAAIALMFEIYFLIAGATFNRHRTERFSAAQRGPGFRNEIDSKSGSQAQGFDIMRTELPGPSRALPLLQYNSSAREFVAADLAPGANTTGPFALQFVEDFAPENGFLVGMDVGTGQIVDSIVGIVPIYQVGNEYHRGKLFGKTSANWIRLIADPGQVVTGVRIDLDSGIQLIFGELRPDGTINPDNPRKSIVVGDEFMGFKTKEFNRPISGLRIGVHETSKGIKAIEFTFPEFEKN